MRLPPSASVAPHGFVVIYTPALHLAETAQKILLLAPGGVLADLVDTGPVEGNAGWSRYPVHGGVWTRNTPLTPGTFNLPVVEDVTAAPRASEGPEPADEASVATLSAGSSSPWRYIILAPLLVALLGLWGLFNRRPNVDDGDSSP